MNLVLCVDKLEINAALVLSFTAFFVYEQYESEIDGLAVILFNSIKESMGLLTRILPPSVASFLCNYESFINKKGNSAPVKHQK